MRFLNWELYIEQYFSGIKAYLTKEKLHLNASKKRIFRFVLFDLFNKQK
jgi:hypothetical protein